MEEEGFETNRRLVPTSTHARLINPQSFNAPELQKNGVIDQQPPVYKEVIVQEASIDNKEEDQIRKLGYKVFYYPTPGENVPGAAEQPEQRAGGSKKKLGFKATPGEPIEDSLDDNAGDKIVKKYKQN
mmetsp:Transcript_1715/g.3033  ORF Transcript_1715/g.3033 Transcript_1715/m.3033 type:complete len:128 (-) Transcript_1715:3313-3696(-)